MSVELVPLDEVRRLYLELLKSSLSDTLHQHTFTAYNLGNGNVDIRPSSPDSYEKRLVGLEWPASSETMIGMKRLNNLQSCIEQVIRDKVPGDMIETGVWRGGATIFMRAVLRVYGVTDRSVWVADSFAGLPPPNPKLHPEDAGDDHSTFSFLAVSQNEVEENFRRHHMLDAQVRFLRGWFRDTLPTVKQNTWSLLRLDGDMYESTMDALCNLYDGLSVGGFLIVDDYGCLPNCKKAVDDFRAERGITDPLQEVDWTGIFWRKGSV